MGTIFCHQLDFLLFRVRSPSYHTSVRGCGRRDVDRLERGNGCIDVVCNDATCKEKTAFSGTSNALRTWLRAPGFCVLAIQFTAWPLVVPMHSVASHCIDATINITAVHCVTQASLSHTILLLLYPGMLAAFSTSRIYLNRPRTLGRRCESRGRRVQYHGAHLPSLARNGNCFRTWIHRSTRGFPIQLHF